MSFPNRSTTREDLENMNQQNESNEQNEFIENDSYDVQVTRNVDNSVLADEDFVNVE